MDSLERRYRRLLFAYPAGYRQRWADEIVGTFLDTAAPGQTRPTLADATDLLAGGLRQRIGLDADADLAAGWTLAGPVALALAAGLAGFLWLSVEPLFGAARGGYAAPPGFGRLAEVLLATCVVLAAMAALSGVRASPHPAGALTRAGGVALGCAAGLAGFLWVGEVPGYGWGPTRGPWAYGAWVIAALAWPVLPAIGRRAVVGAAPCLTVLVALVPPAPPGTALLTLALLGIVALPGSAGGSGYPLPVALVTLAAAAMITSYDNDWRLTPVEAFPHTAALVLTLAIVPFTLAALAGARALRVRTQRTAAVLLILTGTGWVGALTPPYITAWGPTLPPSGSPSGYGTAPNCP